MTFADKLIRLRKKNGMSQEDLADKLGVSRQAISKWEGMLSVPDLQNVLKISELFNVSTDYLLKDSIVEESACAAENKGAAVGEAKNSEEDEDVFFEIKKNVGGGAAVGEAKKTDSRLFLVAGILIFINSIASLTTLIINASVYNPSVMNFVEIAAMMIAGFALICAIKDERAAAIGLVILLIYYLLGSLNVAIAAVRYPQYIVNFFICIAEIAFVVMALIALFFKKPLPKIVHAMAIISAACAVLQSVYFLCAVRWDGSFFTAYPYSPIFVVLTLIATAVSSDGKKEYSHKACLGLAGLTMVIIGTVVTVWYIILLKCGLKNRLYFTSYICVSAIISMIGYVLLPWLIFYERKPPVKGISVKKGYFNIAAHILLTCITAYIWHWIWVYRVSRTMREYRGGKGLPAVVHLILYILVPFYHVYWFYKHGRDISDEEEKCDRGNKNLNVVTMVFAVLMPLIASVALQDRLNAVAVAKSERVEEGVSLEASIA